MPKSNYKNTVHRYRKGFYGGEPGAFLMRGNQDEWVVCRDQWRWDAEHRTFFYFCHTDQKGKSVAAFIYRVEKKLKLKQLSEFGPTQSSNVSWIRMSDWWRSKAKNSLFTALLRAGDNYRRNFNNALYSVYYTQLTRPAVERFLKGFTRYQPPAPDRDCWGSYDREEFCGWTDTFSGLTDATLKNMLLKPLKRSRRA